MFWEVSSDERGTLGYLKINGRDVYAEAQGSGAAVLLLHGGFCSLETFRPLAETLTPDYLVHAYERPGHGRSADISEEYSYARGLADTLEYLDACGLSEVHVIGYSDGAILGLLLARDYPERVRSLVAISGNLDPSAFDRGGEHTALLLSPQQTPEPKIDVERAHYERLSPDGPAHAEVVLRKLFRLWTTEPHIDPAELGGVHAPTLIMAGDRDSIRPEHSLRIAAAIPNAKLCILPGASHGLLAEHPDLVSQIIRNFLP